MKDPAEPKVHDPVAGQIEAYNRRDLEAFVRNYSDDVEVWTLGSAEPAFKGMAAFRERYGALFAQAPELHVDVVTRIRIGNFVFDEERVTGIPGRPLVHTVVVNEIRDGKIVRMWAPPRV